MPLNWIFDNALYGISPTLVVAIATLLVAVAYYSLKNTGLPPGPTGVPFLGYWPFISHKECHLQFDEFKKKYGDVFTFTCTGTLYVNLGSHKALREAHVVKSDCFADRTQVFSLMVDFFSGGVAFINGDEWSSTHKFFTRAMRDRGCLSIRRSGSLYDSTVDSLRESAGEPVDIVELLVGRCNAVLRRALFGEHGVVTEEEVRQIDLHFGKVVGWMTSPYLLPTGNIARYLIFPLAKEYGECKVSMEKALSILRRLVEEHKATYNEDNIRNIIDDYIKERNFRRSNGDPTEKHFTDSILVTTLAQLVGDGGSSMALFLGLIVKALLNHPEEQEKIYRELVEVVGVDRQPTIEDRSRLTYTNAFILEAMRTTARMFPYAPKMECTKETTLCGYRIPKGAITVINFHQIHSDPDAYDNPEKFDPTRFISKEGDHRPNYPVSFGNGKRTCIGEAFSMMHVFLFVTSMVKNFHISLPNGVRHKQTEIVVRPRNHK